MDDMSADQSADLNQSSGIFNEQKKGFFTQIGEKFGGLFRGIARILGKTAVEEKTPDDENFDDGKSDDGGSDDGNGNLSLPLSTKILMSQQARSILLLWDQ